MKGHCCVCGQKRPRQWRESGWLGFKADNDPTHVFCVTCIGHGEKILKHAQNWRSGLIQCRINEDDSMACCHPSYSREKSAGGTE